MTDLILPVLLALAVVLAWVRLARWQARSDRRARMWRFALLAALQPLCAGLLYLTLVPPASPGTAATLVVATARAPRATASAAQVVALPEAPPIAGAERVPDLATALRRLPGTTRLRIVGEGLTARDRDAVRGLALSFDPPFPPRGLIGLDPPPPSAPGSVFRIVGRTAGLAGGSVDLLDPAGNRIDRQPLAADGSFVVSGSTRVAGVALARVRLRNARNTLVEEADVALRTVDDAQPRLLLLAGAASAEVRHLRRWATEAGLGVTTRITAGGGVVLGDAPVAVDAATLARFDAVVVDERSWAGLSGNQRTVLIAAVRGGMGLVARITGPVPEATRRQWRSLGLAVNGGTTGVPAPLGPGVPTLTRRTLGTASNAVPVWRDARGAVLTDWRSVARGRVALWAVDDAFTLVLSGHADRYGTAWGATLAAVSRAKGIRDATVAPLPRAGERVTICGVGSRARIVGAENAALAIDPASGGCAGYWPRRAGWHLLLDGKTSQPFYVYPADALPAIRAQERADATAGLRRATAVANLSAPEGRGASWPWFLALLVAVGVTWWFERARFGRRMVAQRAGEPTYGQVSA